MGARRNSSEAAPLNSGMQNFDSAQKAALNTFLEAGNHVFYVAYDPNTVQGDPEADAIAAGMEEYYREDSPSLIEVIYTRPAAGGGAPSMNIIIPGWTALMTFDTPADAVEFWYTSYGVAFGVSDTYWELYGENGRTYWNAGPGVGPVELAQLVDGSGAELPYDPAFAAFGTGPNVGEKPFWLDDTSLKIWFDAQDESTITKPGGTFVTAIKNKADGVDWPEQWHHNLNRASYAADDMLSMYPGLRFDNRTNPKNYMAPTPVEIGPNMTIVVVGQPKDNSQTQNFVLRSQVLSGAVDFVGNNSTEFYGNFNGQDIFVSSGFTGTGTGLTLAMITVSQTGADSKIYFQNTEQNGITLLGNLTMAVPFDTLGEGAGNWTLGEVMIFDRILDADDRTALYDHLASKWEQPQ